MLSLKVEANDQNSDVKIKTKPTGSTEHEEIQILVSNL